MNETQDDSNQPAEPLIFVSYARSDAAWLERLQKVLKPKLRQGRFTLWDDTGIAPGDAWQVEINQAIAEANLAILLVSIDFLASDFVMDEELPLLLDRAQRKELTVFWIPISHADWDGQDFTAYQAAWNPSTPMDSLADHERNKALVEIAKLIGKGLSSPAKPVHATSRMTKPQPKDTQLDKLQRQRSEAQAAGLDHSELNQQINELKRQQRQGRLPALGDMLCERFELTEHLGKGGFGVVWKAYDHKRKQVVALKLLHSQHAQDQSRRERFFRGAEKMAQLDHPGIVRVLERECQDGKLCFYAMEYLAGGDLESAVKSAKWPKETLLAQVLEVGAALAHAHAEGLIHRDIKPSNILLTLGGKAKLSDFDLVRAMDSTGGTRTGALGSFIFAAPEAMDDASRVDARADVYGLAMTCLFVLHGKALSIDVVRNPAKVIANLNLPNPQQQALLNGLAWECDQRCSDVATFCKAFRDSLQGPQLDQIPMTARVHHGPKHAAKSEADPQSKRSNSRTQVRPPSGAQALMEDQDQWIWFPPASFIMGSAEKARTETIKQGFWLARYPVTNAVYRDFVKSGGYGEQGLWSHEGWLERNKGKWQSPDARTWEVKGWDDPDQPVVGVSWFEAQACCNWLRSLHRGEWSGNQPSYQVQLPTEQQWEYAARGQQGRPYPWGSEEPDANRANFENKIGRTTKVDRYHAGATPEGLMDMAGNVWEWSLDLWSPGFSLRALRGGAWINQGQNLAASVRFWDRPGLRSRDGGFRCCLCGPPEDV